MLHARRNVTKTHQITNPTYYVEAINGEYAEFAFDEDRAVNLRGNWRPQAFAIDGTETSNVALDLEIGTGTGLFFAHHAVNNPQRLLVGIELKFKPLIQCIRRALNQGAKNVRVVRYHAAHLEELFAPHEIDNVYIHHPDPWTKRKKYKHRLMNGHFLAGLHRLQKLESFIDLKTDSKDYFDWATAEVRRSPYKIIRYTENLHQSEWQLENYITQFERIFLKKGQPIYYLRALKN